MRKVCSEERESYQSLRNSGVLTCSLMILILENQKPLSLETLEVYDKAIVVWMVRGKGGADDRWGRPQSVREGLIVEHLFVLLCLCKVWFLILHQDFQVPKLIQYT
jgi:hypothetical protein